jgi:hypothetical protein
VIFRDVVVHASLFLDERAVMQVVSPVCPGNAGPVDLVVAFTGILSTDSALTYTYYEEPEILMLFPAAGIWTGRADEVTPGQIVQGQGVKLSGTGFFSTPLIKCRFMSAGGTNVTTRGIFTQSDASLTCPYPSLNDTGMPLAGIPLEDVAGTPEGWSVYLQVALNGQQYAPVGQNFTYFAGPISVGTVYPPLGPTSGGTEVTVTSGSWVPFVDTGSVILLHLQAGDHEPGAQYDARSGSSDGAASRTLRR